MAVSASFTVLLSRAEGLPLFGKEICRGALFVLLTVGTVTQGIDAGAQDGDAVLGQGSPLLRSLCLKTVF